MGNERVNTRTTFDFSKKGDVLKAYQLSAEAAINQDLPMSNVTGVQRSANGAVRLAELEFRYEQFKAKMRKDGVELKIPLLESAVPPAA